MFVIIFGIVIITADESLMNINLMYLFLLVLCLILRCFWGYSFENLATENSIDEDGSGIDANVEYCSVIKTKLGAHRIVMGAEMDCCDSTDDGRRFYVELKTSREVVLLFHEL